MRAGWRIWCRRACGSVRSAQRHELVDVVSLGAGGAGARDGCVRCWRRSRARDAATRVVYGLRYRLRLVREDRWLVAAVNTTTRRGVER